MTASLKDQLLQLTIAVETAMNEADYPSYRRYVEPEASFFEPQSRGALLQVHSYIIRLILHYFVLVIVGGVRGF